MLLNAYDCVLRVGEKYFSVDPRQGHARVRIPVRIVAGGMKIGRLWGIGAPGHRVGHGAAMG